MPDLTDRPALCCPDCGRTYTHHDGRPLLRAPTGATVTPCELRCACGRTHRICLWVADVYHGGVLPGWPDDPEEERKHGPTIEQPAPPPEAWPSDEELRASCEEAAERREAEVRASSGRLPSSAGWAEWETEEGRV